MSKKDKSFFLIINKDGQFNYSNKGFTNTPHYVSLVTAKYRASDLVKGVRRFFDPKYEYNLDRVRELRGITIRAYKLNDMCEMVLEPALPDMTLADFFTTFNMTKEPPILEWLYDKVPN